METSIRPLAETRPITLARESKLEWEGLKSKKWTHSERLHLHGKDQLRDDIVGVDSPVLGRKHFVASYSDTYDYKPCLRLFPDRANRESKVEAFSVKKVAYVPPQRRYSKTSKLHSSAHKSLLYSPAYLQTLGLLPSQGGTNTKIQNNSIYEQKRGLDTFKAVGTSIADGTNVSLTNSRIKKSPRYHSKGTWKEREEKEIKTEDERAVRGLGTWEQSIFRSVSRQNRNSIDNGDLQALNTRYSKQSKR